MLRGIAVIAILSLSGCAGVGIETAEMYVATTNATGAQNEIIAATKGQAIDALVTIRKAEIDADTQIKLAKINRPVTVNDALKNDDSDTYDDEEVPLAPLAITGDGNVVVAGSTGVDILQEVGVKKSVDGLEKALLGLITQPAISVPVAPIIKGAGERAIETGGKLLGKALDFAPWAIGAYKIGGALEAGASRDSSVIHGDDNAGRTTTTTTTKITEIAGE